MQDARPQIGLRLWASGERERPKKEQTGGILRSRHKSKAKELGKCGRKAMKSDGKWWGTGWTSVTSETLIPTQTPMCPLGSGLSLHRFTLLFLLLGNHIRRKNDGL